MHFRKTAVAALALVAIVGQDAAAQQRIKAEYWYGLTGQLGEVMEEHCKRFKNSGMVTS